MIEGSPQGTDLSVSRSKEQPMTARSSAEAEF